MITLSIKNFAILLILWLAVPVTAEIVSPRYLPYDPNFNTQAFLEKRHSFLAEYYFDSGLASEVIEKWAKHYNVNAKWILARMQTEFCAMTGKVDNDGYWCYPYQHPRKKLVYFLNEICGYGLLHKFGRKYLGFENQIMYCAKSTRQHWDQYHNVPKVLFKYDQINHSVAGFCNSWWLLWPEDKPRKDGKAIKPVIKLQGSKKSKTGGKE